MTSRERVRCALNHEEPDRVPIFFGASGATTIHIDGYEKLKAYLGFNSNTEVMSKAMKFAYVSDEIMKHVGADGWPVNAGPLQSSLCEVISDKAFIDAWGVKWEEEPNGMYFCPCYTNPPLSIDMTIDDVENRIWPDVASLSRFECLKEKTKELYENTDYALVANIGTTLCELIYNMRGMSNWMMDLVANQEFAHALLEKITELRVLEVKEFLERVGDYVDIFITADDMSSQGAPLISPEIYRNMIKPYQAQIISAIKSKTKAKVFYHSCGNIYPLIPDLIEIGVDILNPIQVTAADMGETARLKQKYGDILSFCGAIDTQDVLPNGSPEDVRKEVRRRIKDLAPNGGYICSAVHSIQPDIPPENVIAMFDEVKKCGTYPLEF